MSKKVKCCCEYLEDKWGVKLELHPLVTYHQLEVGWLVTWPLYPPVPTEQESWCASELVCTICRKLLLLSGI